MVNYGVIEEKMCDSCMGEYITYGIGAYTTQAHELITFVSDVFPCKDDAEKFVNVCNKNELSLHHLRDVIEFLLQFTLKGAILDMQKIYKGAYV